MRTSIMLRPYCPPACCSACVNDGAASRAGKTTLLDVLAGRKTQGEQAGRILFAGQKATQAFLKRFTGDW